MMVPEIALISGKYFNYLDPDPDVITIEVIAHALSNIGRYAGHTERFYSVAEHSLRCFDIDTTAETLMHDAAEAFLLDMPTPLKMLLPDYKAIEERIEQVIFTKFNLAWPMSAATKRADLIMLATEKRDLLTECGEWAVLEGVEPLPERISSSIIPNWKWADRFIEQAREVGL